MSQVKFCDLILDRCCDPLSPLQRQFLARSGKDTPDDSSTYHASANEVVQESN